jgi:AcrR family transcriptional regulator
MGKKAIADGAPKDGLVPAQPAVRARKPAQERSRARFQALLDSVAQLLGHRDFTEVGLYDIAEHAAVPPASVYHFFPTKEAAFVALAQRYFQQQGVILREPSEERGANGWAEHLKVRYYRALRFYNENPAFARIMFSGTVSADVRRIDLEFISQSEHSPGDWLSRYFVMPYLPDADLRFAVLVGLYDGIWGASYARFGHITEDFGREGIRAGIAYCRTFLPEVLPLRGPEQLGQAPSLEGKLHG